MKAKSYFLIAKIIVFTVFISLVFTHANQVNAGENDEQTLSISTDPSEILFDVTNIKPGDTFKRTSTIINDGSLDFYYQTEAIQTEGSDKLFNQLELVVLDEDDQVLYDGSLGQFEGYDSRSLASGAEEEVTYLVEFPWESGNEFQGLEVKFNMVTWANADPIEPGDDIDDDDSEVGGTLPSTGGGLGILPQTGESIPYLYYIIGGVIALAGLGLILAKRRSKLVGEG
ncbi:TasA family protein [Alkalibacillus haloalkaliphilus]|uniref:TasA family protein n=1 Tax=Alkalibacillus haloalkaliphilus TaxID=94136 RepID=UPI0002F2E6DD|nr:TasA family protein [Alkalibacillus haloalkaliphilus]